MRFCPFCAQELADDAADCVYCGKRLPTKDPTGAHPTTSGQNPKDEPSRKTAVGRGAGPTPPAAPPLTAPLTGNRPDQKKTMLGFGPPLGESIAELVAQQRASSGEASQAPPPPPTAPPATAPPAPPPSGPSAEAVGRAPTAESPRVGGTPPPPPIDDPPGRGKATAGPGAPPSPPTPPPPLTPAAAGPEDSVEIPKTVSSTPPTPRPPTAEPPISAGSGPAPADPLEPLAVAQGQASPGPVAAAGDVAPMPHDGPPGFFGGVPYLFTVIGARAKHLKAIRQLQRQITEQQLALDEVVRDLGKRAREASLEHAATDGPMTELRALQGQRATAEEGLGDLEQQLQQEQQVFDGVEADCKQRTDAARDEASGLQRQIEEKNGELREAERKLAQEDKQLRTLVKQRDDQRNRANKTQDTAQQEVLQRAVADLGVQIGDWEKHREATQAEVDTLRAPLEALQAQLREARMRIQQAQKELGAARQALAAKKREIDAARRQQGVEVSGLDRQIAEKLLAVGLALDGDRVITSDFDSFYDQIDAHRARIAEAQQQAEHLGAERDNYDRQAYRNGLIIVAGGAGLLLVLIVLVALLL